MWLLHIIYLNLEYLLFSTLLKHLYWPRRLKQLWDHLSFYRPHLSFSIIFSLFFVSPNLIFLSSSLCESHRPSLPSALWATAPVRPPWLPLGLFSGELLLASPVRQVLPPTYPPLPSASSPAQLLFGLFSGEARLPSALPSAFPRHSSSSVSSPARRDSPPPSLRPPLGAALPASPASRSSPPPSQELPQQAQEGQEAKGTRLGWQSSSPDPRWNDEALSAGFIPFHQTVEPEPCRSMKQSFSLPSLLDCHMSVKMVMWQEF